MSVKTQTTRITLDLPTKLHTQVKTKASQNGQTLREFFIKLAEENQGIKTSTRKKMPKGLKLNLNLDQINKIIDESRWPKF